MNATEDGEKKWREKQGGRRKGREKKRGEDEEERMQGGKERMNDGRKERLEGGRKMKGKERMKGGRSERKKKACKNAKKEWGQRGKKATREAKEENVKDWIRGAVGDGTAGVWRVKVGRRESPSCGRSEYISAFCSSSSSSGITYSSFEIFSSKFS